MPQNNFTPTHDFVVHEYRVQFQVLEGNHWTDFRVYQISSSWEEDGVTKYGYNGDYTQVDDFSKAIPDVSGYVKWDGCMEVDSSVHLCGSYSLLPYVKTLVYVWSKATELMGRNDPADMKLHGPYPKNWENYGE